MFDMLSSPQMQVLFAVVLLILLRIIAGRRCPWLLRRLGLQWERWSGLVIASLGLAVVVFGTLGFRSKEGTRAETIPAALYETFQVFAFNVPVDDLSGSDLLMTAMICAMLLATTVAAQGIFYLFQDSYTKLQLLGMSGHVVICGLGRIGRQLAADLVPARVGRSLVILEPDENNPHLAWAREQGAVIIAGDATRQERLVEAGVHRASEVFLVTGSDETNIESMLETRQLVSRPYRWRWWRSRKPLKCYLHLISRDLAGVLRHRADALGDVEVFNALERTARRLLEQIATSTFRGAPLRPTESHEVAHYVILGFGEFGQTLALQLAELAHFENGQRLRLTIVDEQIAAKAGPFLSRHPRFSPAPGQITNWQFSRDADDWARHACRPLPAACLPADSPGIDYVCNVQYVEYTEATDDEFLQGLNAALGEPGVKPAILVCFEEDRRNFAIAERLKAKLQTQGAAWPIFAWIPRQRELSQLLEGPGSPTQGATATRELSELNSFGQCYGSASYAEVTKAWSDWLARLNHLIWMSSTDPAWDPVIGQLQAGLESDDPGTQFRQLDWKRLDQVAERAWRSCQEWQRASNRSSAVHAVLKAAALGIRVTGREELRGRQHSQPPDRELATKIQQRRQAVDEALRRMEHYRWVAERLLNGWSYGVKRDEVRKTRWQLVTWDGLDHPDPAVPQRAGSSEKLKDARIVQLLVGLILSGQLRVEDLQPS